MREARSRFGPYRDSLPLPLWTSKRHGFGPPRPAPPRSACVVRELSGTNCTLSTGIRKLGDAWKSAPTTPSADVWHSPAPSSLVPGSKTPRPAPRSPLLFSCLKDPHGDTVTAVTQYLGSATGRHRKFCAPGTDYRTTDLSHRLAAIRDRLSNAFLDIASDRK